MIVPPLDFRRRNGFVLLRPTTIAAALAGIALLLLVSNDAAGQTATAKIEPQVRLESRDAGDRFLIANLEGPQQSKGQSLSRRTKKLGSLQSWVRLLLRMAI